MNAHIAYFLAALPVIWGFNKVGDWTRWTLGVTFANGAVMVLSALAAALLPYRAKTAVRGVSRSQVHDRGHSRRSRSSAPSDSSWEGSWSLSFLFVEDLGLAFTSNAFPDYIVLGTAVFGLLVYFIMRQVRASAGLKVEYAFREIPPDSRRGTGDMGRDPSVPPHPFGDTSGE